MKVTHYIQRRERRKTRFSCEAFELSDSQTLREAGFIIRVDGSRGTQDEERVTCEECKKSDAYERAVAYNEERKKSVPPPPQKN